MAGKQRRVPRFSAAQKLRGGNKSFRLFVLVILLFPPCFLLVYLFCYPQMKCCFFCLLLCVAILAVFVCMYGSFCCSNQTVFLAFSAHKHNCLVLTFSPCVFLAFCYFFGDILLVCWFCHFLLVFLAVLLRSYCWVFFTFVVVLSPH